MGRDTHTDTHIQKANIWAWSYGFSRDLEAKGEINCNLDELTHTSTEYTYNCIQGVTLGQLLQPDSIRGYSLA